MISARHRLTPIFATVLLLSACALLPGSDSKPAGQFTELVGRAGSNKLVGFNMSLSDRRWKLWITVEASDGSQQTWSDTNAGETDTETEIPVPARELTGEEFQRRFDQLNGRLPANCQNPYLHWRMVPSGSELTWVECDIQDGFVPGSARIDDQAIQDTYDASRAESMQAALEVFGRLLPAGTVTEIGVDPDLSPAPHAYAGQVKTRGGQQCLLTTVLSDDAKKPPVSLNCPTGYADSGGQPFDPTAFDGAALAGIPAQAATESGAARDDIDKISFISQDGTNLTAVVTMGRQEVTVAIPPK